MKNLLNILKTALFGLTGDAAIDPILLIARVVVWAVLFHALPDILVLSLALIFSCAAIYFVWIEG